MAFIPYYVFILHVKATKVGWNKIRGVETHSERTKYRNTATVMATKISIKDHQRTNKC